MKEEIEQILAEVRDLKCKTEKDIEEARVRLLGKKGEITKLFEEFRTIAPELKKEFGQKLNVLKKEATAKIEELKAWRSCCSWNKTSGIYCQTADCEYFPQVRI